MNITIEIKGLEELTLALNNLGLKGLSLPGVEVPKVEVPKVEVPKVEVPKVEVPKVEVPKVEAVREALAGLNRAGHKKEVKAILAKYGASKLSDLNAEDYASAIADAKEVV